MATTSGMPDVPDPEPGLGDLSEDGEWIWVGRPKRWERVLEPQAEAIRPMEL